MIALGCLLLFRFSGFFGRPEGLDVTLTTVICLYFSSLHFSFIDASYCLHTIPLFAYLLRLLFCFSVWLHPQSERTFFLHVVNSFTLYPSSNTTSDWLEVGDLYFILVSFSPRLPGVPSSISVDLVMSVDVLYILLGVIRILVLLWHIPERVSTVLSTLYNRQRWRLLGLAGGGGERGP